MRFRLAERIRSLRLTVELTFLFVPPGGWGRRMIYRAILITSIVQFYGCVYKGYAGPVRPDNELATVQLKAPVTSLIPLFWIPPFNMLNWFAEDWFYTTNGPAISISGVSRFRDVIIPWVETESVNYLKLNRFNSVKVTPKEYYLTSSETWEVGRTATGPASCSSSRVSCTCPSETDRKQNKQCYRTDETCTTPYVVTLHDRNCETRFTTKPGGFYEVFVRDQLIQVKAKDSPEPAIAGGCSWGPEYSYNTTSSTVTQGSSCC